MIFYALPNLSVFIIEYWLQYEKQNEKFTFSRYSGPSGSCAVRRNQVGRPEWHFLYETQLRGKELKNLRE